MLSLWFGTQPFGLRSQGLFCSFQPTGYCTITGSDKKWHGTLDRNEYENVTFEATIFQME